MKAALREYRAGDLEAIFRLDEVCFAKEFRFDRETMRRFAVARNALTLIVEGEGAEIAGFVIVHVEPMAAGRRGYVVTLDVAPAHRRAGLAGRLMDEAEQRAAAAGAARMELHVYAENEDAIRFYERRGYRRVGMGADFYGWALDAWVYRKELNE